MISGNQKVQKHLSRFTEPDFESPARLANLHTRALRDLVRRVDFYQFVRPAQKSSIPVELGRSSAKSSAIA